MEYVITIPSYNRTKTITEKTLSVLKSYSIPKDNIYVFVADDVQRDLYKSEVPADLYGHLIVAKKGLVNARNFITDYFEENQAIVSFDDDVSEIVVLNDMKKLERLPDLEKLITSAFNACTSQKRRLWGIYPIANAFYMSKTISTDLKFCIGHMWGCFNTKDIRVTMDYKEDYERTLKFAVRDGGVIRFNSVAAKTKLGAPGGIGVSAEKRIEENTLISNKLITMFPGLVRLNPRRPGEVLLSRSVKSLSGSGSTIVSGKDDATVRRVPIRDLEAYKEARTKFLEEVQKITVPKIDKTQYDEKGNIKVRQRDLIIGSEGRTMNFGYLQTRRGWKEGAFNKKKPELFSALVELGNRSVPKGWKYSTITLNHNVKAKKHIDGKNVGDSIIVAVGKFTDGGLYIYNQEDTERELYDIKDKPTMFNGALLPHETEAFTGERYTIIYFNQKEDARVEGKSMIGI